MRHFMPVLIAVLLLTRVAVAYQAEPREPANGEPSATGSLSDADQLQVAVQGICPVTGARLGSMGQPIKVKAGEQIVFLCCASCSDQPLNARHWATVQANIARAQQTCPVMGKPVTATMESTIVRGQRIFVCCPPCIDKIKADPEAAIEQVQVNQRGFVRDQQQAEREARQIESQAICPVSGQKLGSMGAPVKVKVGEEHVFLCCRACQEKQLDPRHWATVQANLARAQGICPIMGQPVDATMESTVVQGRKIFVCCPPCIDKIKAAPAAHVAWLDNQLGSRSSAKK